MTWPERLRASAGMWKLGLLFFIAVFGIYFGWFSPTEAAAVAAFIAIIIASILLVVAGAFIFSRFIVLTQFPNELAKWAHLSELSPFWVLMAVMALYIVLGTFLDEVSTILITVPITLPLINAIGYDGIWFGIFVTVMCTIGLITPPTGMTVFVIQAQHPEIPVMRIYAGTLPFLAADFVLIALLILFPAMALWLPSIVG
jgi:TRAP-type C4-dicarboxylate transport system permease large subunit